MSLISLSNDKLLLEISPEMGASITKFKNLKSGKDIFRPFPNKKKIIRKNCYFAGNLEKSELEGDIDEQIEVIKITYDEMVNKIKNSEIIDLKTISAFNVFDNHFKNDLLEFNK